MFWFSSHVFFGCFFLSSYQRDGASIFPIKQSISQGGKTSGRNTTRQLSARSTTSSTSSSSRQTTTVRSHGWYPPAPLRRRATPSHGHPRTEVWRRRSDRTAGHKPWWRDQLCSGGDVCRVRHVLRLRQLLGLPRARLEPGAGGPLAQGPLQRLLRRLRARAHPSVPAALTACAQTASCAAAGLAWPRLEVPSCWSTAAFRTPEQSLGPLWPRSAAQEPLRCTVHDADFTAPGHPGSIW